MPLPRLFLVAPAVLAVEEIISCAQAATIAGDCASIIVSETISERDVAQLQALGLAVLIRDCEPRAVQRLKADGLHVSSNENIKDLRLAMKNESLGAFCATSRHLAMEAAEAGADYVAFAQASQFTGEPLIKWWRDIFETQSVAFDPIGPDALATLLPQGPDFIRPLDEMWQNPEMATRIIQELTAKMTA